MAVDTSSRAAAGNGQTESPVPADLALSPGAEQLATAIDIVWPEHLRNVRKPRSPQLRNVPELAGFATLLAMPRAPAQISLDASHRLDDRFWIDDGASRSCRRVECSVEMSLRCSSATAR
jgi:hypothetical protein